MIKHCLFLWLLLNLYQRTEPRVWSMMINMTVFFFHTCYIQFSLWKTCEAVYYLTSISCEGYSRHVETLHQNICLNPDKDKYWNISINHTDTVIKKDSFSRRRPQAQGSYLSLIVINSISKLRKLDIREAYHWQTIGFTWTIVFTLIMTFTLLSKLQFTIIYISLGAFTCTK